MVFLRSIRAPSFRPSIERIGASRFSPFPHNLQCLLHSQFRCREQALAH